MSIFDDVKNKLDPRKKGNPLDQASHGVEDVARRIAKEVVHPVEGVAHDALNKARHLEENLEHQVENAIKVALQKALSELQKGVLHKAVRVLDAARPDTASIQIGPITLGGINVQERFDALRLAVDNPPKDGAGIKSLVKQLAPNTVSITLSAEIALVFVSSDSLSVGMTMEWDKDEFLKRADRALGAIL